MIYNSSVNNGGARLAEAISRSNPVAVDIKDAPKTIALIKRVGF